MMAKEEDFSSPRKKMKMPFPERIRHFLHPSLPCIYTGRLTKITEGPSSAKSSFDM